MPGTAAAADRYNHVFDRVADGDDWVEVVDVAGLVREHGREAVSPDGIHYSLTGHRFVGDLVAERILARADDVLGRR